MVAGISGMEVYLVGGAVRDELLGLPVSDRDWVVVGASAEKMLELGFTQVGRDFPVFLHPDTHEEYALARTERKNGPGHRGFAVHAGADVSLEEDLARRDLTINAMARAGNGKLVDPFGGAHDLRTRQLRHVSDAFDEDPLRVLRVARFAAQLGGFDVAAATLNLMRQIVAGGGLRELPAERVCQELTKLLEKAQSVTAFFAVLERADALQDWLPEFSGRRPQVPESLVDVDLRYAALTWSLPAAQAQTLGERLKVSSRRLRLTGHVTRYGELLRDWRGADADALRAALQDMGAFKDPEWLEQAPAVIAACAPVDLAPLQQAVAQTNAQVDTAELLAQGLKGPELGQGLARARAAVLARYQSA